MMHFFELSKKKCDDKSDVPAKPGKKLYWKGKAPAKAGANVFSSTVKMTQKHVKNFENFFTKILESFLVTISLKFSEIHDVFF